MPTLSVFIEKNILFQGEISREAAVPSISTVCACRHALAASRRRLAALVVAVLLAVGAAGAPPSRHAAGLADWLNAAPRRSATWSCSTSARRSTAAAPRPIAKAHIPGAVHSDYDKAGWRVTRNGVPFMLPTRAELEKLIGETRHRRGQPRRGRAGRRARHRFRLGRARLLDARRSPAIQRFRFSTAASPPGRPAAYPVETGTSTPSPKIFTATLDKTLIAEVARRRDDRRSRRRDADRRAARRRSSPARRRRRPPRPMATFPARSMSTARRSTTPATNRLKPKAELAAIAAHAAGRSGRRATATPAIGRRPTGSCCRRLLGRKDVRLYYGSMVEWTANAQPPDPSSRTKWDDLKKALGLGS